MVADRIVEQLDKNIVPWHQPWCAVDGGDIAVNWKTGKGYSFLNQMLLGEPGEYITFNQCVKAGGKVKKGATSRFVVFFMWWSPVTHKEATDEEIEAGEAVRVLHYVNVFHIRDCEGIDTKLTIEDKACSLEPCAMAEEIVSGYVKTSGVKLTTKESNRAYYSPKDDAVVVPVLEQYKVADEYYSTLFHELSHSTGHETRLNRFKDGKAAAFGTETYSKEELIAEMGAAMLCNHVGMDSDKAFTNSVAYIQGWKQHIKNDANVVVYAAGAAEKAARMILGSVNVS